MNVLQLTLSFREGGRRRAVTTLLEHLRRLGIKCDLGCLDKLECDPGEVADLVEAVEVLDRRSLVDMRALRRLVAFCRHRGVEVIHAHDAAAHFVGALVRLRLPRIRLLMTFHRSLGFESATRRARLRNAFAIAQSGAIVTGSNERREHFLRENYVRSEKVVRIPFGIDTARFRPDPEARAAVRGELGIGPETTVLGAVGHFREVKGIDVVLRGFQALANRRLPGSVALIVLGDGPPERRQLMNDLAHQGPPGRVIFAGFRTDVQRWFSAFDLFVHGARQEAFGLVLAEAMATGLPIVATRVGGIPDIVREGRTGLLVPSESPEHLADALEELLGDPVHRQHMSEEAYRVASDEYRAEHYAENHLRLYRDLLDGWRPRGVDDRAEGFAGVDQHSTPTGAGV